MKLHIDIETYSSVDIKKEGAYKYAESLDFEILMVAYAFDDGPKKIVDLAAGEDYPHEFLYALADPAIENHAYNATFERICFNAVGLQTPIEMWYCSAVKAAYCGLPLGLAQLSEALGMGDKGKLATGKRLIKYFCEPCKPTKTNGGRHRNMWYHNPEKWEEFKTYCLGDVEAERESGVILEGFDIPTFERENYIVDQRINDRGILVDPNLIEQALRINDAHRSTVISEMKTLTGLDNPNSLGQLKSWLSTAMRKEITSLTKDSIDPLIDEAGPGLVANVLRLRKDTAKTSITKYVAMQRRASDISGRIRGLVQFYGASRTGRWAGRGTQVQNLPRTYLKDLENAREVMNESYLTVADYAETAKIGKVTGITIPDMLSQLIRTTFVAPSGRTFAVSDFSAIEARVIAWLAGEQWRLDVFNTHGKIYEASASAMFNVPLDEILPGSKLRSMGKVAELALGYQGAKGALKAMGAEKMGLSDSEMEAIVYKWRKANPSIVALWKAVEAAAIRAVSGGYATVNGCIHFSRWNNALTITLPSDRMLVYQEPSFTTNRWGKKSVRYKGKNQTTGKWGWVESYGGKFTENIVQAIARDILADAMRRLDKAGYKIVMHVHDEVVCEVRIDTAYDDLDDISDILGQPSEWAPGLPLGAEGYVSPFYKKD